MTDSPTARLPLAPAGYNATNSLSMEKGYRHWHADLRVTDSPLEAGLGFTCKLRTNTDFLGRQVRACESRGLRTLSMTPCPGRSIAILLLERFW
jgi:sarcosine dehydrogenase